MNKRNTKKNNNLKYTLIGLGIFLVLSSVGVFFYHYMNRLNARDYFEHANKELEYQNTYQAGRYLKAALYFDDEYAEAYFLRGKIRCEIYKEYNLALSDLDNALLYTDAPDAMMYYFKGKCNYMLHNYIESVNDFETALSLEPPIDSIHYYLADINTFKLSDFQTGLKHYDQTLSKKPSYESYIGRGWCNFQLKNYKNAKEDFHKATEIRPQEGKTFYQEALCDFALNDSVSGCTNCGNAITLNYEEASELAAKYCNGNDENTFPTDITE